MVRRGETSAKAEVGSVGLRPNSVEEKTGPPSGEGTGGKDGQRLRLVGKKGLIKGIT